MCRPIQAACLGSELDWEENHPIIKQNCPNQKAYLDFVSIIDDNCLTQMVSEPTRDNNILDLFLTNNPTLVDCVSVVPSIAAHSAGIGVVRLRPMIQKVKTRTVHLYSKADWEGMRQGIQEFQHFLQPLKESPQNSSGKSLWERLKPSLVGMYRPNTKGQNELALDYPGNKEANKKARPSLSDREINR